jgi:hypothetical protein
MSTKKSEGEGGEGLLSTVDDVGGKHKVALSISGVVIEEHEVEGLNMPSELIIELPINTSLSTDRSVVSIDKIFVEGLTRIVKGLISESGEEQINKLNAIISVLRKISSRVEGTEIEQSLEQLKLDIKKMLKEYMNAHRGIVFLPNMQESKYIDIPDKMILHVDSEVCPIVESLEKIPEIKKIVKFSAPGKKVYVLDFKEIEGEDLPIYIDFGDVLLINKRYYREDDEGSLAFLNLALNAGTGYELRGKSGLGRIDIPTTARKSVSDSEARTEIIPQPQQEEVLDEKSLFKDIIRKYVRYSTLGNIERLSLEFI